MKEINADKKMLQRVVIYKTRTIIRSFYIGSAAWHTAGCVGTASLAKHLSNVYIVGQRSSGGGFDPAGVGGKRGRSVDYTVGLHGKHSVCVQRTG